MKRIFTFIITLGSICGLYGQEQLYIHYVDKSFDGGTNAFVKNEIIMDSDSARFFETRYKDDFSDSVKNVLLRVRVDKSSFEELSDLIDSFTKEEGVFCHVLQELNFDRSQELFARRIMVRCNGEESFIYDVPYEAVGGISNNRKKLEMLLKAMETCISMN